MYPTLKQLTPDPHVIKLQSLLSANGYFVESQPPYGLFDSTTNIAVKLFQAQHIDKQGKPLSVDGEVGKKTWWALENASGPQQRSHIHGAIPEGITDQRKNLLTLLLEEHQKPVFENPDGSNRSPDIDAYWGDTGLIGYAWCCAFVSWALKESLGNLPIDNQHHVGVQKMWRSARRLNLLCEKPKPGDIFVQIFSGGKGHTGFVLGVSTNGKSIYTLEGNCGNRLKCGKRNIQSIEGYIDALQDNQNHQFQRSTFDVGAVDQLGTR